MLNVNNIKQAQSARRMRSKNVSDGI